MDIKINFKEFDTKLTQALATQLDKVFRRRQRGIETRLKRILTKYFRRTLTYKALTTGTLQGEFGIVDAKEKIDNIIDVVANSIHVEYKEIRGGRLLKNFFLKKIVDGLIEIRLIPEDLQEILELEDGSFVSENEHLVNWLEWLLTSGNQPVVFSYKYVKGFTELSRTGKGIMVKAKNGFYRVPPRHSGIIGDNWITRTILENKDAIRQEMLNAIRNRLSEGDAGASF